VRLIVGTILKKEKQMSEKIQELTTSMETPQPQRIVPNIFQRILGIMSELKHIAKGDLKVNGQYTFVSHDAVAAKVHPLLVKYGVAVIPTVEEMTQDHNRTTVKLAISFVNSDCPSDYFISRYLGYGIDNGDKGPGKAISYAYKYGLLKTFCLETGDDPDNDATAAYEPPKCLEFDSILPNDMNDKDKSKLKKFLAFSSQVLKLHVEDVKREAVKRPEDFLKRFNDWNPNKKGNDV
jgi:hypothetical protein